MTTFLYRRSLTPPEELAAAELYFTVTDCQMAGLSDNDPRLLFGNLARAMRTSVRDRIGRLSRPSQPAMQNFPITSEGTQK